VGHIPDLRAAGRLRGSLRSQREPLWVVATTRAAAGTRGTWVVPQVSGGESAMSRRRPTASAVRASEGAPRLPRLPGQPGLVHEEAVPHRDQPVAAIRESCVAMLRLENARLAEVGVVGVPQRGWWGGNGAWRDSGALSAWRLDHVGVGALLAISGVMGSYHYKKAIGGGHVACTFHGRGSPRLSRVGSRYRLRSVSKTKEEHVPYTLARRMLRVCEVMKSASRSGTKGRVPFR
jgi:hypothetical protein